MVKFATFLFLTTSHFPRISGAQHLLVHPLGLCGEQLILSLFNLHEKQELSAEASLELLKNVGVQAVGPL